MYLTAPATPDAGSLVMSTDEPSDKEDIVTELPTVSGSCVVDNVAYTNGSSIPPTSSCQESCVCLESDVQCRQKACPSPPPSFLRCKGEDVEGQCCPSYDCRK